MPVLPPGILLMMRYALIATGGFIILLLAVRYLPERVKRAWKKRQYLSRDIRRIDAMEGIEFENYLKAHFESHGYQVELTPASGDMGADLLLYKSGKKIAVQAKRWKKNPGVEAVQQLTGALRFYDASMGIAITNVYFTPAAVRLAQACDIELWDRDKLIQTFINNR